MSRSPLRNHRSKGVKVKQVLQICFLLAICFWLIYEVEHSRDKKKALDETDANKQTVRTIPSGDILKLGRKDLNPKSELINGKSNEETEDIEETVGEEEDNKIELVTEEEAGDEDDENGRDGVDELEKSDSELDREEENKEKDVEGSGESVRNEESLKEKNVEDETKSSTHESRDENYKADDASSAVTQTSRFIGSETEVELLKKSTGKDSLADENLNLVGNISRINVVEERETAETTKSDPADIVEQNGNKILADIASRDVIAETTTLNAFKNTDSLSNKETASETHDSGSVTLDFKKPVSKQAEGNTQFSDIKSDVKAEAKPDTDVKALTLDDDALNAENGGEVQRDLITSDSATSLVRKDDGTDMDMLANVLNEDSNEEEAAAE